MLRAVGDQDLLRPGLEARFSVVAGDCLARSRESERIIEPVVDQRGIFVRRKSEKVERQLARAKEMAHREIDRYPRRRGGPGGPGAGSRQARRYVRRRGPRPRRANFGKPRCHCRCGFRAIRFPARHHKRQRRWYG